MEIQKIFICYLLLVNLLAFSMFGIDKWKAAHRKWRIREAALLGIAFAGGAAGGWAAMYLFRHKTKHWYFRYGYPALAVLQIIIVLLLIFRKIL